LGLLRVLTGATDNLPDICSVQRAKKGSFCTKIFMSCHAAWAASEDQQTHWQQIVRLRGVPRSWINPKQLSPGFHYWAVEAKPTQKLCMCIIVYVLLHPSFAFGCLLRVVGHQSYIIIGLPFSLHPSMGLVSFINSELFLYIYIPKLSSIFFWVSLIGDIRQVTLSLGHSLTLSLPTSSPVLSVAAN
jgi:hypothetical protein